MNRPKISIVTPSYNQGQYIEETIQSVLDQNYENLEYIIIDGGSTDNTTEIIKKYDKYIKFWVSEPDEGQSHAINKGIAHCKGEIFNWLNSDDVLVPDSLDLIASEFEKDDVDIVSGKEYFQFEDGREDQKAGTLIYPSLEETIYKGVIYQPSTFWKLEALKPFLPVKTNLHYLMDADLWMRYLLSKGQHKVKKIDSFLVKFRIHEQSKTGSSGDHFIKQRWTLRWHLLKQLGAEDTLLNMVKRKSGKPEDINVPLFQINQHLDPSGLFKLVLLELIEDAYSRYDYSTCRPMLRMISYKELFANARLLSYWVKINLIPKIMLNAFRK